MNNNDNAKAMVLASFLADSLALGAHWIYSTNEIDQRVGRVDQLLQPLPNSYHQTKNKGEFTHYGDQTLALLEAIAAEGGFSLGGFAEHWRRLFVPNPIGYIDKATAATLENMNRSTELLQVGSSSSDLGGAARIAPLLYRYRHDLEQMREAVRLQTTMTHHNPAVLAGADFIARTVWQILHGSRPVVAMETVLEEGVQDFDLDLRIRGGLDSAGKETKTVIGKFGQMCGIAAALPGAIHLIATYEQDLRSALIENVMAGGDSAARGLVAGMVLGASLGMPALPEDWLADLSQRTHILDLLASLDARA